MKKIYLSLLAAVAVAFSSCDMDKAPIGSIDDENAIESIADLQKARNGIYNELRSFCTGSTIYLTDIQMDQFIGLTDNGNRNGMFAHGNILSSDGDIETLWGACYAYIADANYLLGRAQHLIESGVLTDDEVLEAEQYMAETKFARAYYYAYLMDHWCETYSAANANTPAMGVPVVTVFNPTGDVNSYPGRSTQAECYELIDQDLNDAYNTFKLCEQNGDIDPAPMAMYLNSNVVRAFQARLALLRSDWTNAVKYANEVINTGVYTLATVSNYDKMWSNDDSQELIFRPVSTNTELGISSTGSAYISATLTIADYIPTYENLAAYEDGDMRFDAFFNVRGVLVDGNTYQCYAFNKYPGNRALYTSTTNNLMNMGKPFRLSETYLILAEAAAEAGDEATANSALNTLRKNRIVGYTEATYNGAVLRQQIREERAKELLGEGFRMSDLRRWGLGFTRDSEYPINPVVEDIMVTIDKQVQYIPGDYRYVWPIPTEEINNNPQIRGQQNPGY